MKLNIANPDNGAMKTFDIDDEKKLVQLYDKRMAQEVEGDALGDAFKGYVFRITGGNDKQGFPMAQGILSNNRVRLLMSKGFTHYRQRRTGERKRKSVRGCIVGADLATLNLVIAKKGEKDIEGLTTKESERARRLGLKRASKLRKFFRLNKEKDDVCKYVISRKFNRKKSGKPSVKRPKIQRLVTPRMLRHKAELKKERVAQQEKNAKEKSEYKRLVASRKKEAQDARTSAKQHRLSARRSSKKEGPA